MAISASTRRSADVSASEPTTPLHVRPVTAALRFDDDATRHGAFVSPYREVRQT